MQHGGRVEGWQRDRTWDDAETVVVPRVVEKRVEVGKDKQLRGDEHHVTLWPVRGAAGTCGTQTEYESDGAFVRSGEWTRQFDGLAHEHDDSNDEGLRSREIEREGEERDQPVCVAGRTEEAGARQRVSQRGPVSGESPTVPSHPRTLVAPKTARRFLIHSHRAGHSMAQSLC